MLSVVALLSPVAVGTVSAVAGRSPLVPASLSSAVAERLRRLDNVSVTYREVVDYTPTINLRLHKLLMEKLRKKYGIRAGPIRHGHYASVRRLSYLHGRVLYEFRVASKTMAKLAPPRGSGVGEVKVIKTFTPERSECLRYALHGKFPIGTIKTESPLPWSRLDVALGLRGAGSEHWLRPSDVRKMRLNRPGGGRFNLVQKNPGAYDYRWTFREKPHLELVGFMASNGGAAFIGIKCGSFRNVHGLWLPERIKETVWPLGGGGRSSENVLITHIAYTVGSQWNTPNRYLILFPQGSAVLDERIGQSFRIESRSRRLTDKAIFHLLVKWDGSEQTKGSPHQ